MSKWMHRKPSPKEHVQYIRSQYPKPLDQWQEVEKLIKVSTDRMLKEKDLAWSAIGKLAGAPREEILGKLRDESQSVASGEVEADADSHMELDPDVSFLRVAVRRYAQTSSYVVAYEDSVPVVDSEKRKLAQQAHKSFNEFLYRRDLIQGLKRETKDLSQIVKVSYEVQTEIASSTRHLSELAQLLNVKPGKADLFEKIIHSPFFLEHFEVRENRIGLLPREVRAATAAFFDALKEENIVTNTAAIVRDAIFIEDNPGGTKKKYVSNYRKDRRYQSLLEEFREGIRTLRTE